MADLEHPADNGGGGGGWAMRQLLKERTKNLARNATKLQDATARIQALEAERDAAIKERDTAVERAKKEYDATGLGAELDRLKGELRLRDHRAVFDRLAKERDAYDDTLELIYQRSGYTPQADAPDEEAIAALLDAMRDRPGDGRLFGAPGRADQAPPSTPPPGSGQGRRDAAPGRWRVSAEQMKDGAWCMANAQRLQAARKDGTLEILP
jgi:hypothetical protein